MPGSQVPGGKTGRRVQGTIRTDWKWEQIETTLKPIKVFQLSNKFLETQ
jgi:hypothetical protein